MELLLEPCWHLLPVCKLCCGAGLSPGCCGVHHLPKARAAVGASGPPSPCKMSECRWLWWGQAVKSKLRFEQRMPDLASNPVSITSFPPIQTSMSLGLWMDLVCSVQKKIMSWLLQHELLSLLPRRKVMALEEGFGGRGRLTLDIAQSCSVMRCCNCSTRNFPKAVADSFPKTKQVSFLYLWLRSHYVTCPP